MNESPLQKLYKYPKYPRVSKIHSDNEFVNIDNRTQGGTHWTCFYIKVTNRSSLIVSVVKQIHFYSNTYLNQ